MGTFYRLLFNSKKFSHFQKHNFSKKEISIPKYNLRISDKEFDIRMRTYSGDISIFYELFWKDMYSIPDEFIKPPKIIIDLGAHVGFASIYYALKYKEAKIYSIEASKENFKLLKTNTSSFQNITVLNNAVYFKDGEVLFDESGLSYNTKISDKGEVVKSVSIPALMQEYGIKNIDLLKIDIEGAEKELLEKNNNWLECVNHIIIELHKPYDLNALKNDLEPYGFKIVIPNNQNGLKNIFAIRNQE